MQIRDNLVAEHIVSFKCEIGKPVERFIHKNGKHSYLKSEIIKKRSTARHGGT
jgi:hypothetical protein